MTFSRMCSRDRKKKRSLTGSWSLPAVLESQRTSVVAGLQPSQRLPYPQVGRRFTKHFVFRRSACGLLWAFLLLAALPVLVLADETRLDWSGHVKGRALFATHPDNSILRDALGEMSADGESDLRLNLAVDRGRISAALDYQALVAVGDSRSLATGAALPGAQFLPVPDDRRRLMDLSRSLTSDDDLALLHRVDRAWLGYSGDTVVVRVGRQALTWGGGLFFSPLDIVNPFDPAFIDTEYKIGDDMLFAQLQRKNGDDVQFAYVARRDPADGRLTDREATAAVKYHRVAGDSEFDLLIAKNYGRTTAGVSLNRSLGGAIWRADIIVSDADEWTLEFLTNLSYSWMWAGKNVSGALEYYYNGFGQKDGRYDTAALNGNPELLGRLTRSETFSLGQNYLAGGVTVELTPLWSVTPNLLANLDDPSALLQLVARGSLGDNLTFLAALNLNIGPDGSEYGGLPTPLPGQFLSRSAGFFAQLAWYF